MKIILTDDYFIKDNGLSYDLMKDTNKLNKKGNPVYQTLSYHSTIDQAVNSFVRLKAYQEIKGNYNLDEYREKYNEIVIELIKVTGGKIV